MDKILTRLNERRRGWRVILLGLLLVALAGPWFFERLHVPAGNPCDYRLEEDYCGYPISGLFMVGGALSEMAYRVGALGQGESTLAEVAQALLFVLVVLLALAPIAGALRLVLRGDHHGWQVFQVIVCGLAAVGGLLLVLFAPGMGHAALWGSKLYVLVALCALALEIITLRQNTPAASGKK